MKNTPASHNKITFIYVCCFLFVITLTLINIVLAGRTLTASSEFELEEQKYMDLQKEKELLTLKLSQQTSLKDLEQKAIEAGYVPISQTIAVRTPAENAVALR